MAHAFISYAREDKAVLEKVKRVLMRARRQGWIDTESIIVGGDYRKQIDDALRSASVVIVLLSPAAAKSPYVTYEWSFALGAGVRVIPVLIKATDLHPCLTPLQNLDITMRGKGNPWQLLVKELRRKALPIHSESTSPAVGGPELIASFELSSGRPKKVESSYKVWIETQNVPEGTKQVQYEIFDESFSVDDRKFTVKWGPKNFSDWITSYGDIFLAAKGKSNKGIWRTQSTLVEALKRKYRTRISKPIRNAITKLEKN